MPSMPGSPVLNRSKEAVLRAATQLLIENPSASLAELAASIGIGRTTLHRQFRDRSELVAAIAGQALDDVELVYRECGLGGDQPAPGGPQALEALLAAAARLIPMGPSLMFLLRDPDLAGRTALTERAAALDRPLHAAATSAAAAGLLDSLLPPWWAIETLYATVWVGWEQIAAGRLAPADAPGLVRRTWLSGVVAPVAGLDGDGKASS